MRPNTLPRPAAGTACLAPASTGPQFGMGVPLGTAQALMGFAAFSIKQKLR